ncbi:hypothetical protein [Metabacillus fastidiosus]|uniref:Uncharacterized protein n=1 Tax=Metabacillus fastidiosus TaxID=1458 RepID=A0ABU6NT95_9BACI|nr:hypothetical protein [Metabacillus fastidiosus]
MDKCCLVECNNPVMENSKVRACEEHEEMIIEIHEEESRQYEQERWSDYYADVMAGIRAGNVLR